MFGIVGDIHGHHHNMVSIVQSLEKKRNVHIQFLLQVGDFEAHRNKEDLTSMAAPQKYRKLGDFPDYYNGSFEFHWPIYFIGGNHEPYGWYDKNINGFKIIDNCYYMGRVGTMQINGIKIIGISGIYSEPHFTSQRPGIDQIKFTSNRKYTYYNESDIESALMLGSCDILLTHDWPKGIISEDDYRYIIKETGLKYPKEIGCEYTYMLIEELKPKIVACGHMHFKYFNKLKINGNEVQIFCLPNVKSGVDSLIILDENLNKLN